MVVTIRKQAVHTLPAGLEQALEQSTAEIRLGLRVWVLPSLGDPLHLATRQTIPVNRL